jgi:hypothetical protein
MKEKLYKVGQIENYYGGLVMKETDGKYFWGIEDWNGTTWEMIPFSMYTCLKTIAKPI